jgi:hypothetical protein
MADEHLTVICYRRWQNMTWQEAVKEAAEVLNLAVKLDDVRELEKMAKHRKRMRQNAG